MLEQVSCLTVNSTIDLRCVNFKAQKFKNLSFTEVSANVSSCFISNLSLISYYVQLVLVFEVSDIKNTQKQFEFILCLFMLGDIVMTC